MVRATSSAAAPASFDAACQRWRELYQLAADEKNAAHALNSDTTASPKQREEARRRYQEASRRVELLLNESDAAGQSDFYTYRYLASEGFLPGYSFPRLPLERVHPRVPRQGLRAGCSGPGSWRSASSVPAP